jgi:hypothetical protein
MAYDLADLARREDAMGGLLPLPSQDIHRAGGRAHFRRPFRHRRKHQPLVFVIFRRVNGIHGGAPMLELTLAVIFGFALGYGVRAAISHHRRRRSRNARR